MRQNQPPASTGWKSGPNPRSNQRPASANIFPNCAPKSAPLTARAKELSVARRPIAAGGRSLSSASGLLALVAGRKKKDRQSGPVRANPLPGVAAGWRIRATNAAHGKDKSRRRHRAGKGHHRGRSRRHRAQKTGKARKTHQGRRAGATPAADALPRAAKDRGLRVKNS